MGQQQPIRVVVEKKPSGCWGVFGVMLLIGLAIEYWYVSLGILVLLVVVGAMAQSQAEEAEAARSRRRSAIVPDRAIRGSTRWRSRLPTWG